MLTKDDLMKLDKERLCELLLEEWIKNDLPKPPETPLPNYPYNGVPDCFHVGTCTNPYHDCVNCPRLFSSNGTTGTNLQPLNK